MVGFICGKRAIVGAGLVIAAAATPAPAAAQVYGYDRVDQPASVVVECAPGQRAVMEQTRINGRPQVVARCVGRNGGQVVYDAYGRPLAQRTAYNAYDTYRPARRSTVVYQERIPRRRSTSKSVLGIAGSAATGAGIGGIVGGKKGALIGAAIGGGSASIYEAAKRR